MSDVHALIENLRIHYDPGTFGYEAAVELDRLITEADTAERWKDTAETLEADYREKLRTAERDLDEARKALELAVEALEYQFRGQRDWSHEKATRLLNEVLDAGRAALASLTDTDSEGDPVLDALARGDESMAARLTTEREQMLRGRVVLTAEKAEQIASRLNHVIRRADTSTWSQAHLQDALALLRGQEHPKARLDAANKQ